MSEQEKSNVLDRDQVYQDFYDRMQRAYLKTVVCDEIIEEHRRQPLGQHSEPLERLLLYFRRVPQKDKYAIKRNEATDTFSIIALSGVRGERPRVVSDEQYQTLEEAYHAVFLKRVQDLMES